MKKIFLIILALTSFSVLADCKNTIKLNSIKVSSTSESEFYKNKGEYLLSFYSAKKDAALGQVSLILSDEEIGNLIKIKKKNSKVDLGDAEKIQVELTDGVDPQGKSTIKLHEIDFRQISDDKFESKDNILEIRSLGFVREIEYDVIKVCK